MNLHTNKPSHNAMANTFFKYYALHFALQNIYILCRMQTIMKAFIEPIKGLTFQYRFAKICNIRVLTK